MIRFVQQLGLAGAVSLTVAMGLRAADLPGEILQESGWTGGVAVCVGYDEAGRISPLPGSRTQLLESDSQSVARARTRVIAEKVGDKVTVKGWEHGFLPYADNLVNVIVYRHGAGGEEAAAVKEEIRRVLFTCGVPFFQDAPQLRDSIAGDKGGVLIALDDRTGQLLSQTELPAAPVWDGMAAAGGSLFISKKDGSVSCYH